jgi:quinol monooxygenase YgiN
MRGVEVSVRMKVRDGQLAGLEEQATRCIEQTRQRDTKTLRYDWFLSDDGTRCEINEAYVDSDAVIEEWSRVVDRVPTLITRRPDPRWACSRSAPPS